MILFNNLKFFLSLKFLKLISIKYLFLLLNSLINLFKNLILSLSFLNGSTRMKHSGSNFFQIKFKNISIVEVNVFIRLIGHFLMNFFVKFYSNRFYIIHFVY